MGKWTAAKVVVCVRGRVRVGHLDVEEADLAVLLEEEVAVAVAVVLLVDGAHAARVHRRHARLVVPGEGTAEA